MASDDLTGWKAFVAVAEYGSFAKASRELRIAVSILSKRVSTLETQLKVRLFQRSTRVVSLTEEGARLLPAIKSVLEELLKVESSFSDRTELTGVVRVASIPFIANRLLMPVLQKFTKLHPKVKVELLLTEQVSNLIENNIDIAVRVDSPENTDLIYRQLVPNKLVFCASPKYLQKNQQPVQKLKDLHSHDLLFLKIHTDCKFLDGKHSLKEFVQRKHIESDSGDFLTELALKDFGVLVRSVWDVREHLSKGRLVQVMKGNPLEPFGYIYAVLPNRKFLPPRTRAFYDLLLEESKSWMT